MNYEHFRGTPLNIRVIPFLEKDDAALVESYLIVKLYPKYNRAGAGKSLKFLKSLQGPIDQLKASARKDTDLKDLLDLEPEDFKDLREERIKAGKKPPVEDMVEIFKTDPDFILKVDPELHTWLSFLGTDKAEALQFRRSSIKAVYKQKTALSPKVNKQMLKHWFKVGQSYLPSTIVQKVAERTGTQPKNTQGALKVLRKYYEVTPTSIKGVKGYKIKRIL